MKPNDDIGYVYIAEETSGNNFVRNMSVHDDHELFYIEFDTCLQDFDSVNRNNRIYRLENVRNCLNNDPKIQSLLKDNAWFGEMDHPTSKYVGIRLSPERIMNADMSNTSHKIMRPRFSSNELHATIQTDSGTKAGKNMANKIIQGMIPAFSSRGIAKARKISPTQAEVTLRRLITYDWVLFPSHERAHWDNNPVFKTVKTDTEVVTESSTTSYDTIVPLNDILKYTAEHDDNVKIMMESFEMDNNNLVGFTPKKKQLIMQDDRNTIYCNLNMDTRKKVSSFLANL